MESGERIAGWKWISTHITTTRHHCTTPPSPALPVTLPPSSIQPPPPSSPTPTPPRHTHTLLLTNVVRHTSTIQATNTLVPQSTNPSVILAYVGVVQDLLIRPRSRKPATPVTNDEAMVDHRLCYDRRVLLVVQEVRQPCFPRDVGTVDSAWQAEGKVVVCGGGGVQ